LGDYEFCENWRGEKKYLNQGHKIISIHTFHINCLNKVKRKVTFLRAVSLNMLILVSICIIKTVIFLLGCMKLHLPV